MDRKNSWKRDDEVGMYFFIRVVLLIIAKNKMCIVVVKFCLSCARFETTLIN